MKKGIGPQGLGAPKSPAKMYGAKSPAKQVKKVHTDEMGREGHFNPYTKRSKADGGQPKTSFRNAGKTQYANDYQNKFVESTDFFKRSSASAGDMEHTRKAKHKTNNVMGLRAEAYKAKENKFGVKKPKANIK